MAEESRGTGACTVSASKEDSDDVAGYGFGKRHLFCQTVDGSTKAANNSNRLIGDRDTAFVRSGYRLDPPDHCAEIAAGRSEALREGTECVRTCRSRCSPNH